MTRELLNQIAKIKKINLDHYSKVCAWINEAYTKLFIEFYEEEGTGFSRTKVNRKMITMNVSAILKREEHLPEEYETNIYGEWIFNIK